MIMTSDGFVSEFPNPPYYYKAFIDSSVVDNKYPPKVPDNFDALKTPYNGAFHEIVTQHANLSKTSNEISSSDLESEQSNVTDTMSGSLVKVKLKELLKGVVLDSFSPLTASERNVDVNECKIKIDDQLDECYTLLKGIRKRQTRNNLLKELKLQVELLESREEYMNRVLQESCNGLKDVDIHINFDDIDQGEEKEGKEETEQIVKDMEIED